MSCSSMYRARLREWHETEGSPLEAATGYPDKLLDSRSASDLGMKPSPPVMDGHAVLLADRCSPDTSHRKLPLPLLLPLLPFLLLALLWVACLLTATIYALQLMEQLLEFLDPTPPDQFRDQPVNRTLYAETSTSRLTRSGSFCCGWLWATDGSLAPEKPLSILQRVQCFLRAPRRRLQLLMAESTTATLLEAPWLLLALWRGTATGTAAGTATGSPPRRGGRGSPPQLRRVTPEPKRAYFFVLARDELVWHTTEAGASRDAVPAGSIRLDSIVEARSPRLPPLPTSPAPPPPVSSSPPLRLSPPPFTRACRRGQVLVESPLPPLVAEEAQWPEEGVPPLHCFPLLVRTSASRSTSRRGRSQQHDLGARRWSPTTVLSLLSSEVPPLLRSASDALLHGVTHGAAGSEGPADMRELHLAAASEVEREGWIAMLHKATKLLQNSEHPELSLLSLLAQNTEPGDAGDYAEPAQPRGHALFGALSGVWRSA